MRRWNNSSHVCPKKLKTESIIWELGVEFIWSICVDSIHVCQYGEHTLYTHRMEYWGMECEYCDVLGLDFSINFNKNLCKSMKMDSWSQFQLPHTHTHTLSLWMCSTHSASAHCIDHVMALSALALQWVSKSSSKHFPFCLQRQKTVQDISGSFHHSLINMYTLKCVCLFLYIK